MTSTFYIFVDGSAVSAHRGQTTLDAIAAWQPDVAVSLNDNSRVLADSRGLPIDPALPAYAGAIFRVVSSRQLRAADASAPE